MDCNEETKTEVNTEKKSEKPIFLQKKEIKYTTYKNHCYHCLQDLSLKNSWRPSDNFDPRPIPYCISCQDKYFQFISASVGYKVAMFLCCVKFNVPYFPDKLEASEKYREKHGTWGGYIELLKKEGLTKKDDKWVSFSDGLTDIQSAFSGEFETLYVDDTMLESEEYKAGKASLLSMWGTGSEDRPYTEEDYKELMKTYNAYTKDRPFRNEQSELTIISICKWTLERDKCMELKQYDDARKIEGMIDKAKEGEQLRKKDELPQDTARLDDIVLAIERAGLHIMDYDELCKELATKTFHEPYPYTRDVADQMLLLIRNCTAWNDGRPEVERLSDEFAIVDELGEFATVADEEQKKIYNDLQISPLGMNSKNGS